MSESKSTMRRIPPLIPSAWMNLITDVDDRQRVEALWNCFRGEIADKCSDKCRVYPNPEDMCRPFECSAPDKVKVIIFGTDPLHGEGQADGLAFSTRMYPDTTLLNIFAEAGTTSTNGDLTRWAKQGVLLVNMMSVSTGVANRKGKHRCPQSYQVMRTLVRALLDDAEAHGRPLVLMRWGNDAMTCVGCVFPHPTRLVLDASHPSPLSYQRSFQGCDHFRKCNEFLQSHGLTPIDWS